MERNLILFSNLLANKAKIQSVGCKICNYVCGYPNKGDKTKRIKVE